MAGQSEAKAKREPFTRTQVRPTPQGSIVSSESSKIKANKPNNVHNQNLKNKHHQNAGQAMCL